MSCDLSASDTPPRVRTRVRRRKSRTGQATHSWRVTSEGDGYERQRYVGQGRRGPLTVAASIEMVLRLALDEIREASGLMFTADSAELPKQRRQAWLDLASKFGLAARFIAEAAARARRRAGPGKP